MAGASAPTRTLPPPYREPEHREPEPGRLGQNYRQAEDLAKAAVRPSENDFDGASYFGLSAAGWFGLMSLLLLILPRLVLFFAQGQDSARPTRHGLNIANDPVPSYDRGHFDALTSLEEFALRMLGFGALALAAICLFVVVPNHLPHSPPRVPAICVITIMTSITSVVCWNSKLGALATITGIGNGTVACWGWWVLFFSGDHHKFGKYLRKDSRLKRL